MKGLILLNAYLSTPTYLFQSERLKTELETLGVEMDVKRNDEFLALIEKGEIRSAAGEYDFCIYLDKDKYMSEMLEKTGLKLFNSHDAVRVCDDKMETFIRLAGRGIPMPKTLSGLLCFDPSATVSEKTAERVEKHLSYPIVVKESFGSLGKGVYMANNRDELLSLMQTLKCRPHLFQEAVLSSLGKDVRVIVVGGKAVCAMLRQSSADFRSNIELGGVGSPFVLTNEIRLLCEKIAVTLGLDYCGIDILLGEDCPLVCEVNSNAFFGGIEKITGCNVAKAYAEHIFSQIYR